MIDDEVSNDGSIKDILIAAIGAGIGALGFKAAGLDPQFIPKFALYSAGIPLGWHLCSKIITAVSFQGVLIKLIGALLVGVFALPVVLVLDLIGTIRGLSTAKRAAAR